jgi:cob(I)alamin adenosyltransferase
LERVKNHITKRSFDLAALTGSTMDKEKEPPLAQDYISSLEEAIKRINKLLPESDSLMKKLPE